MKKWLMMIVVVCAFSVVSANNGYTILTAKESIKSPAGYFVLSDGSLWKVVGFVPRMRGLSEWWNDVQLAPETYKCVPNDWIVGAQIVAYPKFGNLGVDEENASNQDALRQCSHLLVNQANGQVLFANPLDPALFLTQVFKEAHRAGYDKGYTQGFYEKSSIDQGEASKNYDRGYSEGYALGCSERSSIAKEDIKKKSDKAYSDGYALGCSERGSVAQEEIKKKCDKAYSDGYALGCSERSSVAKEEGGKRYQEGYNAGYADGLNDGHQIGVNDAPPSYDTIVGENRS